MLGADRASMKAECAGEAVRSAGLWLPLSLKAEIANLARQTGVSASGLAAVFVWQGIRNLRALEAPVTPVAGVVRPVPAALPERRGEIARRLGVER